ncbi:MAG TPA: RyR domain-containing protein [Caulobacteraceae bacterium]|jgi:hypothetical protein
MSQPSRPFRISAVWVLPVLAVVTVVLGVWGWMAHHYDFDRALYEAGGLFNNADDHYTEGIALNDWRFRVARWTGVVVLFSTVLLALATLLQRRIATAMARRMKQSVVVIGGDALATTAFEVALQTGKSLLWLGAPTFDAPTLREIALPWPTQDRAQAVRDHVRRAEHMVIAHHDDAEALTLARAARSADPTAHITVLMRDVHLAEEVSATLNEARTRVLSQGTIAARALNIDHPPFLIAKERGHSRIHALIIGYGQTGQAIARDLIVNCRTTYLDLPRITVIDPQARALEGVLRVRAPEIDACAQPSFVTGEISGRAVHPEPAKIAAALDAGGPITAAYVCLANDLDALSAAAMLQSLLRAIDVDAPPIFVRVREFNIIAPTGGRGLDALIPFGDLPSLLEASEFLSDSPDVAARAFCEAYRINLAPALRDDPNNRSAYPWDRLDETYRQANRDAVAHIHAKLASAGIDPALWRGKVALPQLCNGQRLFADAAELETLAELEHERWLAQRRMDGWRWTDRPKRDDARRLHPSLIAYADLADDVKEYDRVYVRQTQDAVGVPGEG